MKTYLCFFTFLVFAGFLSCKSQTQPTQKFHTTVGGVEYTLFLQDSFLRREAGDSIWLTLIKRTSVMEMFDSKERSLGKLWRYETEDVGFVCLSTELGFMVSDRMFPEVTSPMHDELSVAFSFSAKLSGLNPGEVLCHDSGRQKTRMDWIADWSMKISSCRYGFVLGQYFFGNETGRVFVPTKNPNIFLYFKDDLDEVPEGLIEVDPKPLFTHEGHRYKKYKYLWSF